MVKTMLSTFDIDYAGERPKKRLRYLLLFFVFLTDFADFACDWLFFVDIQLTKQGLVYGAVGDDVRWSVLFFSVLGTILFALETCNFYKETKHDESCIDSDILSAVVVWFEDIPQILISLYLVLCREEAISVFQFAKASVVLIGMFIRVIQVLANYFKHGKIPPKHHRKIKCCFVVGVILETLCSIAVFILTQTAPTDSGISFQVPKTLIEETFNDRRYFANVSVFVNHADYFDVGGFNVSPRQEEGTDNGERVMNWMRLASIDYIMGQGNDIQFSLEYETDSSGILKLAWWEKSTDGPSPQWRVTGCYLVNQTHGSIAKIDNFGTCVLETGFFSKNSRNTYITFNHTPPGKFFLGQVFGDITFNMRLNRTEKGLGQCLKVDSYTNKLGSRSAEDMIPLHFQYFRTAPDLPPQGTSHLLHETDHSNSRGEKVRFFRNDGQDLININEVWKTGWLNCESKGSLSPSLDDELPVDCSRDA
ncbi:hypothetical protein PoB_003632900 [Plakobranchus ocellatus]|uniref:Uncharacterized protein n=1 Tax=Plakobranchus ocellatus TaxID=259542 RepID=A0AAV4AUQ8_9GAST|nr:hypothetical protein PoB_003632900 [Plakobranchus ocellatus]